MGCFGKCGCEECCMSDAELADIASSVTIQHTIYNQTTVFSEGDCCHVAEIGDPDDYGFSCHAFVTNDIRVNESITVRSSFYRSQTYIPATPIETCVIEDFFASPDFSEVCGDLGNCASTTKTYAEIEKIAGFVRWKYGRTRASILKRIIQCPEYEQPQCKYIVECSVEVFYQTGGLRKKSVTKNATTGSGDGCCHPSSGWTIIPGDNSDNPPGSDCYWNQTQAEPSFDCTTDQSDVSWGALTSLWLRKFKVYDTAEDIPSVINLTNSDTSGCTYEPCQDGEDEFCINIIGDNLDPAVGGNIVTVVTQTSCGYCIQTEPLCFSSECTPLEDSYCSCDPNKAFRHNNVQGIATGFDSFAYVNNPYAVSNGVCMYPRLVDYTATTNYGDCDGCLIPPLMLVGEGVPPSERTECNWFDCMNCLGGDDPFIPRIQPKQNTVDAYSFSSSADEFVDTYCIPFPSVTLTLNP